MRHGRTLEDTRRVFGRASLGLEINTIGEGDIFNQGTSPGVLRLKLKYLVSLSNLYVTHEYGGWMLNRMIVFTNSHCNGLHTFDPGEREKLPSIF